MRGLKVGFVIVCHLFGFAFVAQSEAAEALEHDPLDAYDVVWDTPSKDSSGSMPIGNGDIGLNVWVEEDGDLLFYISKTDAWSENVRLLKLGRVRVKLSPNPFRKGLPFRQTLKLREAWIEIHAGESGEGGSEVALRIWVDANEPVVHVEARGQRGFNFQVSLEIWRKEKRLLEGKELFSAYGMGEGPHDILVYPDTVLEEESDRLVWFHRNEESVWPLTMKLQGLDSLTTRLPDPLLNRTFGGAIWGFRLVKENATTLKSKKPNRYHYVSIYVLTAQTATVAEWLRQLDEVVSRVEGTGFVQARLAHRKWWNDFWNRSWIRVSGRNPPTPISDNGLPLRIGADSNGQSQFIGRISRARVFNRALGAEEAEALAQSASAGAEGDASLVADWRFSDPKNGSFANSAANDLPARIVGEVDVVEDKEWPSIRLSGHGWIEVGHDERLNLTGACTLDAWVCPENLSAGGGRIIDKSKAGTSNGYLLDTYPGNSLRLIVEAGTLVHDAKMPAGKWSHVAATFDSRNGEQKLYVNGKVVASQSLGGSTYQVSQGYALQRFISACGGRGAFPIKFNGSIFTVDSREPDENYDADYRRWGGPYWFQNTRLAYWPMLGSGDFDLMAPLFRMYREALSLAEARTRLYFGHEGAFLPETMYFWGAYANENYGWDRKGKHPSHVDNTYIRYYWSCGLEFTAVVLDYYFYTLDDEFLNRTLLPIADEIVRFYDLHYPRDEKGTLLFKPAQSLETWQKAVNPLPEIAGLRFVLSGLLSLPAEKVGVERRSSWQRLLSELPPLPSREEGGKKVLLPAEEFDDLKNIENPELYAIFPYRLFGVGKPGLEVGRLTFEKRRMRQTGGWAQDAVQAAFLGLADTARQYTSRNFSNHHTGSRFPAFWGPNYDWIPDQDHGCVAMIALQTMLMQTEGDRILLFPAWPKEWDVEFKLRAPWNTTVEGVYRNGKLERLKVAPEDRTKDVVKMSPQ